MHLYAHTPLRALRQGLSDVLAVVLVVLSVWAGKAVQEATLRLGEPGRRLAETGTELGANLRDAAESVGRLPVVGEDVQEPISRAGQAADVLVRAGQEQQAAVGDLATLLGLLVTLFPVLVLLLTWLPARVRFVRRAAAAQRFLDADADLDLFALRAMANQPMSALARISDDPVTAWRNRDAPVVRQLASLELRSVGLRPPPGD